MNYDIVLNDWYWRVIAEAVGRLSHWRGNTERIWGNVLVTDTMRADADSAFVQMHDGCWAGG